MGRCSQSRQRNQIESCTAPLSAAVVTCKLLERSLMAVPNFESILVPALRLSGDGKMRTLAEVRNTLAVEFALTPVDLAEVLPSGSERRWNNRVSWACFYLTKA